MVEAHDWNRVIELGQQLQRGEALELTDDLLAVLRRVARDVAISDADAQAALANPTALLQEVNRRIRDGSRRLSRALVESNKRKEAGDLAGARAVLKSVLAVEVVPLYREQAQVALEHLD